MISLDNLTVSFGGTKLFDGVSFIINPKDRIGLIGRNGAGKTTLFRLIMGEAEPSEGRVIRSEDFTIGYLPQQMQTADTTSLFEETAKAFEPIIRLEKQIAELTEEISQREDYQSEEYSKLISTLNDKNDAYHILGGDTREADIEKTLLGLGFKREEFTRATSQFSGGWRMRIELAKILLKRPSIFLLDEPTNHLDIESIAWLEEYISSYNGALLLISHDKAFLDNVTNRTVEISLGKAYDYKASYSKFVELRKERRAHQTAAYENQQRLIEKSEEFIEKFRYKPTKSNQVQSRIKQLEKLERIEIDDEDTSRLNIKFPPAPRSGDIVAEVKNLAKAYGEKVVFSGANFTIERGQKIALVGRNGEGKTTFARLLRGEVAPTQGTVKLGANVDIGYFAQNQDDLMDGDFTVFDTLDRVAVGDIRTRLRDILGAFLFRGEDVDKRVRLLSGGERSRLAMARLMLNPHNLLILDEPTNHMDMSSKELLKDAVKAFNGSVVIVSHDRDFLDGLVDRVYEFRDGGVKEYLGGIYYFLEKRQLDSLNEVERKAPIASKTAASATTAASGKQSYAERKEQEKVIKRTRRAVTEVEEQLASLEENIKHWDSLFAQGEYSDSDFTAYEECKALLDKKMGEWERLSYELEILTLDRE